MTCCGSIADVFTPATAEAVVVRKAACDVCETRRVHFGIETCGLPIVGGLFDPDACGCILAWKRTIASQKCPQGKW